MSEKISEPHTGETPDVFGWRKSLRSPSPSGPRSGRSQERLSSQRSRSPSPGQFHSAKSLRSRSRSPKVILKGRMHKYSDLFPGYQIEPMLAGENILRNHIKTFTQFVLYVANLDQLWANLTSLIYL